MKYDGLLTLLACVLVFQGVAQTSVNVPVKEMADLAYLESGSEVQQLNLVLPQQVDAPPLFIWIGGGAWSFVDRNVEMDFARQMARKGIAVASVGHRLSAAVWRDPNLSSGVQHPAHIQDIAQAFVWLYDHAETYGYSQEHIFIGGFSSGAHLAALLATDGRYLKALGSSPEYIKGVIPIGGTFDIIHYREVLANSENPNLASEHVDAVFGNTREAHLDASPLNYLDQLQAEMLIFSDNDLYTYTKHFEEKLKEAGYTKCDIVHISRYGHGALWRHLSRDESSEYRDIMVNFIQQRSSKEG